MGPRELADYRNQFEKVAEQTRELTSGLSEAQFNWRPGPQEWSIEECLSHLVTVGHTIINSLENSIHAAKATGITGQGPFPLSWFERMILRQTEPPTRRKFSAPRRFQPVHGQPITAVLPTFLHLQRQFIGTVEEGEGLDLKRIKVPTPMSRLLRVSFVGMLAVQAAHERRHLEQARRVREHPQFPRQ